MALTVDRGGLGKKRRVLRVYVLPGASRVKSGQKSCFGRLSVSSCIEGLAWAKVWAQHTLNKEEAV